MAAASNLSSCARLSWTKQCISRSSTIIVKTYERACLRHMFRRCSFSIFACHSTLAQSIPECIFSRSAVKTHPRTYRRILQSSSYYPDHLYLRFCSSSSPLHISQSDPQVLTETFLSHLCDRIRKELNTVSGEFMQLGSKENPDERFNHYLEKTYKKTASLVACCCRAVAVFGDSPPEVQEIAYQYGRNVGMAFQVLHFRFYSLQMWSSTMSRRLIDVALTQTGSRCLRRYKFLVLFFVNAVIFSSQFPELNALIMRRFKGPNDVEEARQAVHKSDGIARSYTLASQYTKEAVKQIHKLSASPERDALISITHKVLQRRK
ncbi:PREDICTED: decaprenyl-diphosphate synthase subunit 1-like [Acropora digitifera]|uniref:decaprenyl-diphosphate synthase subunit 1-like n=1 Tax=Acropora digitifera TaxID=70779 RepID=UPI00077A36EE|nr:PREDICTED: decaprenyl-diphosphate synthase subunit 1-like [Acropora digitifera]